MLASTPLLLFLSCDDDEQAPPPEPPGPVAMMIGELRPRGSDVWQRDDPEPITIGCDRRLGVRLYIYNDVVDENGKIMDAGRFQPSAESDWKFTSGDYLLRPPGTCTRAQCGVAKVTVESLANDAVVTAYASVDTVVVDVSSLGDAPGTLKIRAELLENGRTLAMRNGQALADELELSVSSEDCAPDGEGGAGGEGGTPTAGTAGSSAATGGSAGSSAGMGGAPGGAPGEGGGGGV
ncbi:MAG TPA: hypothetical protein VFZ53_05395 [Polyangiaceae bacterium]